MSPCEQKLQDRPHLRTSRPETVSEQRCHEGASRALAQGARRDRRGPRLETAPCSHVSPAPPRAVSPSWDRAFPAEEDPEVL